VLDKDLVFEIDDIFQRDFNIWKSLGVEINRTNHNSITLTAKKGTHTDLASVSRALWTFISPWDVARAAVIHDILYAAIRKQLRKGRLTNESVIRLRQQADTVFLDGMKAADPNIPTWKINICYYSVRTLGKLGIRKSPSALVDKQ
jgi:hypothetical protein